MTGPDPGPVVGDDELVRFVTPPADPVDGRGDWEQVAADLQTRLPADYPLLVERYGLGQFADYLSVLTPFGRYAELVALPPDPQDGLLAWGYTVDEHSLCWRTAGDPDDWRVVVRGPDPGQRYEQRYEYDTTASGFVLGWLSGAISCPSLRRPPPAPWFEPYRDRVHIAVDHSDGGPPYPERLRSLRSALGPSADRSRPEHFSARGQAWLVAYEEQPGTRIQAAVPPADVAPARDLIRQAVAGMGCRVLTGGGEQSAASSSGRPTNGGRHADQHADQYADQRGDDAP